jgi:tetratricopeptide (TPR) repeat protein
VHAVLGDVSAGPFAVPGSLGGLVPNPGLVEGSAVALAWDVRDGLDPDQWSRIMIDRQELPAADELMSLRFSGLPARRAYMAAGSLMRFFMIERGMDAFVEAYRSGSVADLTALERDWHDHLAKVQVTPHERGIAEVALARSSIFSAACPHALAKLRVDLAGDLSARDDTRLLDTCRAILDIDPNAPNARAALIGVLARSGRTDEARSELDALRDAMAAPKPLVANAIEAYADASWTLGRYDEAETLYGELLEIPRTDGPVRQTEVKKLALDAGSPQREIVYQMLLDRSSSPVVVHLAHRLSTMRNDGLGQYLQARQLVGQGQFGLAAPLLEDAARLGLPTKRLRAELNRLMGVSYFALERYSESADAWRKHATISAAAAAEAERWLERIEYATTGAVSPQIEGPSSARRAAP